METQKYKSCHILKHGLCFFYNAVYSCCFSPIDQINNQLPPVLYANYKGEQIEKDDLFAKINAYNEMFKNGKCPKSCEGCYQIQEKEWDNDEYIDYITISHFSKCNADCIYCTNGCEIYERTNNTYEILPFLKDFKEKGIIKQGCELHIGGGEFTIYKECDEILKLFAVNNYARVFVPTNAIVYSDLLFQAMDKATTYIIVSLDCGSRKLYKKIKRTDSFDKVINSLKKYAATEKSRDAIRLKYIIIPTVNDSISEFKKFLKIAKRFGIRNLIIDSEARYSRSVNHNIDEYYINLAQEMNRIALKQNFITEFYSFYLQCVNNKDVKKDSFLSRFIKRIKLRQADNSNFKELYTNHKYGDYKNEN